MIGFLRGTIYETTPTHSIIDVEGVGYIVYASNHTLSQCVPGEACALYIHTVVREQSLDLYGFIEHQDKELFELLINISGIGPKVAIAIQNATTRDNLISAVLHKDSSILTKVSGIGKKNAEKIILELQNKIDESWQGEGGTGGGVDMETFEALEALGYKPRAIQEALADPSITALEDSKEKIRQALRLLS